MFQSLKVDFVSLSPDASTVNLYIVADQPWTGSDPQLNSLQEKVQNYVAYALDGPMLRDFPTTAGVRWRIVIDSQVGTPDARTSETLAALAEAVRSYGGDLLTQLPQE